MVKKKCNFLAFVLVFFVLGTIFFGCVFSTGMLSAEDSITAPGTIVEKPQDVTIELEKPNLTTFRSVTNYATKQLNNSKGYKSHTSGYVSATAFNYGFKQSLTCKKQVNHETDECYAFIETRKSMDIGTDKAYEFYQNVNEIKTRVGSFSNGEAEFLGESAISSYFDFQNLWGALPIEMISKADLSVAKNTRVTFTGKEYIAKYDIEASDLSVDFGRLVRTTIDDNSIYPVFEIASYTMTVDSFGNIVSIHASANFTCDISFLGLNFTINGRFVAKEIFYSVDENVSVKSF